MWHCKRCGVILPELPKIEFKKWESISSKKLNALERRREAIHLTIPAWQSWQEIHKKKDALRYDEFIKLFYPNDTELQRAAAGYEFPPLVYIDMRIDHIYRKMELEIAQRWNHRIVCPVCGAETKFYKEV